MSKPLVWLAHLGSIYAILAVAAFGQQPAGPFGLHKGMTRAEVLAIVGNDAVKENEGDDLVLGTVPKPHASFESYILTFSPTEGLVKIIAVGNTIITNRSGDAAREEFNSVLDALKKTYGDPNVYDFVNPDSRWREQKNWMTALLKQDRSLVAYWVKREFPNQITAIALETEALSESKAYLALSYQFEGFTDYLDAKDTVF